MVALWGLLEIVAGMHVMDGAAFGLAGACMILAGIPAVVNVLTRDGRFASAACGLSVMASIVCGLCGLPAWIAPNIAYAVCVMINCRTSETA